MIDPNSGCRIITYKLTNKPSAEKSASPIKSGSAIALGESRSVGLALWGWYKLDINFPHRDESHREGFTHCKGSL